MQAWVSTAVVGALELAERPVPELAADEALVEVEACGVCRTDLHVIDKELTTHRPGVIPGHQVVGIVCRVGAGVHRLKPGDRVGVAWLRRTCGTCRWCREGRENLCSSSRYTGWDADGGFARFTTVPECFAYLLPADADPVQIAPLLCAGIIGYRALRRANLPPGGRLGVYGFGSSAHITAQLAMAAGAEVYAMTRGKTNRELAGRLGVSFVGDEAAAPPVALDSAIVFAPAGELVPVALQATERGGTVVLAGIHMSDIPGMGYEQNLFHERDLRTVTANTRADGAAFFRLARALRLSPSVTRYPFTRTGDAIRDLRAGAASGSLVITAE
ncbi:zinc-dependent alcohol dehydrogenase family protein [Tsukamurella tyrosinosolvens]|uniref:zinc-dependent alcohol dehydrogenase family protein n=1 Tax=Tsukamurella tyrosinosolvens TaxID=57704 RepID=UPI000C7EAA0A|nr:zinc-dependent alcohol dehydrogenase family protein [Tsukamurella tyrosinosolvens]AUN43170.1 alcohol dehydrogenase [Tsukamurella tyrosinosolvens]